MGAPPSALKMLAWEVKRCCDVTGSPNATSMSRLVQRILLNDMVPPFVCEIGTRTELMKVGGWLRVDVVFARFTERKSHSNHDDRRIGRM
jgi:hypothetical protein